MVTQTHSLPSWISNTFHVVFLQSYSFSWDDRDTVAYSIMTHISPLETHERDPFCLWLIGPLGAGKTTLTGAMLRTLGYPPHLPILSPTYTLMGDYPVKTQGGTVWYAHLDLYRLGDQGANLEDFGILDAHSYRGLFIEWPERATNDPSMTPTHLALLEFGEQDQERQLSLYKVLGRHN
jgi:tRNA threonylcarbamoyl adenosine modification protein YjeE